MNPCPHRRPGSTCGRPTAYHYAWRRYGPRFPHDLLPGCGKMVLLRRVVLGAAAVALGAGVSPLSAQQACPAVQVEPGPDGAPPLDPSGHMPLKYKGGPTVADITACDLMTRLYIYSDDSMMGRRVGNARQPAGDGVHRRSGQETGAQARRRQRELLPVSAGLPAPHRQFVVHRRQRQEVSDRQGFHRQPDRQQVAVERRDGVRGNRE